MQSLASELHQFLRLWFAQKFLQEMKGQSIVFFLSGYETTATALTLLVDILAKTPHVQEKLQQELDEHFPDKVKMY